MKSFTLLRKFIPLLILVVATSSIKAQNVAFNCNEKVFVSHGTAGTSSSATVLEQLSYNSGTGLFSFSTVATSPNNIGYNGIGLNPIDGYMYGIRYHNGTSVSLVKVGSGTPNNVNDLGLITTPDGGDGGSAPDNISTDVWAGCFDAAGTYYFIDVNNVFYSLSNAQINGARTATILGTLSGSGNNTPPNGDGAIVDIAINPVDGTMYGVSYNSGTTSSTDYRLYSINKANGALTSIGQYPAGAPASYIAALFFREDGGLYGYRSNGQLQLINKTNASTTAAGNVTGYTYADGCSCSFRVAHDLDTDFVAICPTIGNQGKPTFSFLLKVQNLSAASRTGTTYTLTMSNRFSFTELATTIAANFAAAGLTNSGAVLNNVSGGTKNQLVVSGMTIPNVVSSPVITIGAQLINHLGFSQGVFQSAITGLPAGLGGSDLSNDPDTGTPDDPTVIDRCDGIGLPVKLLSFTGTYKNNNTLLNWVAENQTNFASFEIERSSDGNDFTAIGNKPATGSSTSRESYQYADNLSMTTGTVFYYRLKIIDLDGSFRYSNIIMIRKNEKIADGISMSPNPVVSADVATARIASTTSGTIELSVIDMSGKVVLRQQNKVNEGVNSISINNIDRLQPGIYVLKMNTGETIATTKFSVIR